MSTCPRRIFAERFDGALARYTRRTNGTTDLLTTFALQAGGEGGDLRHTHASLLLRLHTPMKVVQERLGHSTFAITADIYSHVSADMQENAATLFGDSLRGPIRQRKPSDEAFAQGDA